MTPEPTDDRLNALIDGELAPVDAEAVLERMRADPAVRERACEIRLAKELVRHAYAGIAAQPRSRSSSAAVGWPWRVAAAALLCSLGALLGWTARQAYDNAADPAAQIERHAATADAADADRVVLHVGSAAPDKWRAVLDHAEGILEAARAAGQTVAVEIVANGGGLGLLREDVSTQAGRIAALRAAYPSLALIACGQTAQRLREAGVDVRLLPGTVVETSALDEIVRRMQQGWTYVRI
jgi:intracellular sulfur oxidation DsrE/DsrF family protein